MSSTFFGVELAKRGLQAQRAGMNVVSNNVANVNTDGYSRQRAYLVSSIPYNVADCPNGVYQLGTGADLSDVQRLRDSAVGRLNQNNLGELGFWEQDQQVLSRVEAIFPDAVDGGMEMYLDDFFNAWQSVNENPLDSGLKVGVLETGRSLSSAMNQYYEQLTNIGNNLNDQLTTTKDRITRLCGQIIDLGKSITKSYANNNNVLLDQRDNLVDELAKLVKIDVKTNQTNNDYLDITVDGISLINGTNNSSESVEYTVDSGGAIGGIIYAQTQVGKYRGNLKTLAHAIVEEVNGVYANPPINEDPPVTRPDEKFFKDQDTDPESMIIMELDVTYGSDVKVGLHDEASGDTRIALAIAQLRNKKITTDNLNCTFEAYNQNLLVGIGQESKSAQQMQDTYQSINDQLYAQQQSVSGVSIDEEMANLMQYQVGYQSAAKIFTSMDEMLQTLLDMVR